MRDPPDPWERREVAVAVAEVGRTDLPRKPGRWAR
jgi:hypothetical protein